jgi:hypothetical protein
MTSRVNRIGAIFGVGLLLSAVAGCGGQGDGGGTAGSALPSVTRSVTRSPAQPSVTRDDGGSTDSPPSPAVTPPSRSGRPSRTGEAPKPSEAQSTRPESAQPESAEPEPAQPSATGFATTITATPSSTPSSTPSATQPDAAASTDEDASVAAWVWWLLGLLVAAAVLTGTVLVRRRRSRTDWAMGLADALDEATWLSEDLIPTLQGQSVAGRSGVWAVDRARVRRLEQSLEGLAGQAPDDVTARHCTTLTSVVRALRQILDQSETAGVDGGEAGTTALHQAQRELDEAIAALRARSGGGGAA